MLIWWLTERDTRHSGAFLRMVVPALACLLLSTAYHLFMAQVKHYRFWLTADVRLVSICKPHQAQGTCALMPLYVPSQWHAGMHACLHATGRLHTAAGLLCA